MFFHADQKLSSKKRKRGFIQPLNALLESQSPAKQTLQQAQLFAKIQEKLAQFLHQGLGDHCHVVHLEHDTLVLAVPHAALASKLRQLAPSIAAHLNQDHYQIKTIHIKVHASLYKPTPTENKAHPSQNTQACHMALQALLDKEPHSPLAPTLRKILGHSKE